MPTRKRSKKPAPQPQDFAVLLDAHTKDEERRFDHIQGQLHFILNEVSANGTKGLEASLKDIYQATAAFKPLVEDVRAIRADLAELRDITKGDLARRRWLRATQELVKNYGPLSLFRTKIGALIAVVLGVLVLNTVVHALGANFDLTAVFQLILRLFRGF